MIRLEIHFNLEDFETKEERKSSQKKPRTKNSKWLIKDWEV